MRAQTTTRPRPTTEVLVDAIQRLSLARRRTDVQEVVRHAARELTGADGATFVLREDDKCFYVDEDAIEPLWKGQRFPMSACVSGWVMTNRQAALIPDIYEDGRVPQDAYRRTFVRSLAMVPIRSIDPIGAIGNYWALPYEPSPVQVGALQSLADATAVALENVSLAEEATTDKLTGLLNRRGFFGEAEPALDDIRANDEGALVAYADLDGLKTINDRDGHEAGDAAIRAAAEALVSALGAEAIVGRIGGDEFAALVAARRVAPAGIPGVSLGIVASHAGDERGLDELLAEADARMYRGRGRGDGEVRFRTPGARR